MVKEVMAGREQWGLKQRANSKFEKHEMGDKADDGLKYIIRNKQAATTEKKDTVLNLLVFKDTGSQNYTRSQSQDSQKHLPSVQQPVHLGVTESEYQ